jgi:hypothetical protein
MIRLPFGDRGKCLAEAKDIHVPVDSIVFLVQTGWRFYEFCNKGKYPPLKLYEAANLEFSKLQNGNEKRIECFMNKMKFAPVMC